MDISVASRTRGASEPDWIQRFRRDGFIASVPILGRAQCRFLMRHLRYGNPPKAVDWVKGLAVSDRLIYQIATRPTLVDALKALLGGDVILWGASFVTRPPHAVHDWHCDIESSAPDGGFVSVWIGLEHTAHDTSMQFAARSHTFGKPIQQLIHEHGTKRADTADESVLAWVHAVDANAAIVRPGLADGEAIVFDGRIWHGSRSLSDERTRTALLLQYAHASVPVRIPDFHHQWPFVYYDAPRPPVVAVCGTADGAINRVVRPPAAADPARSPIVTLIQPIPLPLAEDPVTRWKPYRLFDRRTPVLDDVHAHVSVLSPGHTPHPPHAHTAEEVLIVLDGEAELVIAQDPEDHTPRIETLTAGSFAHHPPYHFHTIRNAGERPVTYLMIKWRSALGDSDHDAATSVFHIDGTTAPRRPDPFLLRRLCEYPTPFLDKFHAHLTDAQPGAGYEPHVDAYDAVILILSGTVETLGRTIGPDNLVYFAAGEPHGLRVIGDAPARYLVFEFQGAKTVRSDEPASGSYPAAQTPPAEHDRRITTLMRQLSDRDQTIAELSLARTEADTLRWALARAREELTGILSSRSWTLTRPYRWLGMRIKQTVALSRLVPQAARLSGGAVPLARKVLRVLLLEGMDGIRRRIGGFSAGAVPDNGHAARRDEGSGANTGESYFGPATAAPRRGVQRNRDASAGAATGEPGPAPDYEAAFDEMYALFGDRLRLAPQEFDPRRVLMLAGSLGPGGAERQIACTALGLMTAKTHEVVVACNNLSPPPADFHLPAVERAGARALAIPTFTAEYDAPEMKRIRRRMAAYDALGFRGILDDVFRYAMTIRTERPGLVHTWMDHCNVLAGIAADLVGVPAVVMSGRSMAPDNFVLLRPYMRPGYLALLGRRNALILNNSRAGAADYARWLGIDPERIRVIPNGFDFPAAPPAAARQAERQRHGIAPDGVVVGGVIRFSEEKRPHMFIDMARILLTRYPEIRFLLFGDGLLVEEIRAYVRSHGLSDRIKLPGITRDPWASFAAMDVAVLTSRQEGLPNVLIEAQACGIPVVAAAVGGVQESIVDGETGFGIANATAEGLADAVSRLIADEPLRRRMSDRAFRHARANFALDRMIRLTQNAYGDAHARQKVR